MLEPIPFAGMVEIDEPVVCCNNNCNQGRNCPIKHDLGIAEAIGFEKGYQAGLQKAKEK
jgi:hypothetical protein